MSSPRAFLGLDFGTTNASVSYLLDDPRLAGSQVVRAQDVLFEVDPASGQRSARVPTLLMRSPESEDPCAALTGWPGWHAARRVSSTGQLLRHGCEVFRSVKADLGRGVVYRNAFARALTTPEAVAGRILRDLLRHALAQLPGVQLEHLVVTVTVPAALGEAGRRETREAAEKAGLEPGQIELIDEPVAALIDLLSDSAAAGLLGAVPRTLALYDYGGGTLDVTLVEASFDRAARTGLRVHTLAIPRYAPLGGDLVDQAVMRGSVWPEIARVSSVARRDLPLETQRRIEDTFTPWVARGLKEDLCRKATQCWRGEGPGRHTVAVFQIPRAVEGELFDLVMAREFRMSHGRFERLLAPLVRWGGTSAVGRADLAHPALLEPLVEALDLARLEPSRLDAVVLHGGGCRNPYLRQLLHSYLGDTDGPFGHTQLVQTPDLDASVARGAAISGYWKHARGEVFVAPVVPAEIGVITLSDRPVPLVEGGCPLPHPASGNVAEAETVFAVPDAGLRRMLVPFYTGRARPPRPVGTVAIDLPPGLDLGAEVRLRLRVDADKTFHWWIAVDGGPFEKPAALPDPWAPEVPSVAERRLLEVRRNMRRKLTQRGKIDVEDLLREASCLLDLDELDETELLLEEEGEPDGPLGARWHNLKALIRGARGDEEGALAHARMAARLQPKNAVLLGNLAVLLARQAEVVEASQWATEALRRDRDLLYVRLSMARSFDAAGFALGARTELDAALEIAQRQVRERPDDAEAHRSLALVLEERGADDIAVEVRARARALEKDALYGGDHRHRIAGPDSGYVYLEGLG